MNEREADVRAGFAHLRNLCDPRGHDLLRVFEELLIEDARRFSDGLDTALAETRELVFACDPDESGGYAPDDPKSNGYHSRRVELWDLYREGK